MKIAFISLMKILPWGGSEELWYKAAKLAIARGHSVVTLTQRWPDVPAKVEKLRLLGANTQFYYTPIHTILDKINIRLRLKQNVPEIVPQLDADLYVISNGSVFDFIYNRQTIAGILASGKPYIMISQHNVENGNIVPDAQREYAIDVVTRAKAFYFVSDRNLQVAERQIPHRISNSIVISNPINIKDCLVKPYPKSERLLMACVARLDCAFKGQDILLQVLSSKAWRSREYRLNLYGSGPHLKYLQQLVKFYNLTDKVSIVGHVNDIDELWMNNQVMILPSLSEGTPLALMEAMLSGRAALSTDVGGNATYIRDGDTGFLADVASVSCIAMAMEKVWASKAELSEMGVRAFNHALKITDLYPEKTLLDFIEQII
jgi:glycosyltransferase involved in cell wall biosynthesis